MAGFGHARRIASDTFEATIAEKTRLPLHAQGYSLALGMAALRAQENQHLTSTSDLEIRRLYKVASDLIVCLALRESSTFDGDSRIKAQI